MNNNFISVLTLFLLSTIPSILSNEKAWSAKDYPDIREKPWDRCGQHVPPFGYVCDPTTERIISRHDGKKVFKKFLIVLLILTN